MTISEIAEEAPLWQESAPPSPKKTGRRHARPRHSNYSDLLREFKASGARCWRKDYPEDRKNFSKAAESDATYLSTLGRIEGVKVSRRGASLYLEPEGGKDGNRDRQ